MERTVTPRMRCVSRNENGGNGEIAAFVTPRMRCVSRNSNLSILECKLLSHTSHEVCE